jgi:hypothetical protein
MAQVYETITTFNCRISLPIPKNTHTHTHTHIYIHKSIFSRLQYYNLCLYIDKVSKRFKKSPAKPKTSPSNLLYNMERTNYEIWCFFWVVNRSLWQKSNSSCIGECSKWVRVKASPPAPPQKKKVVVFATNQWIQSCCKENISNPTHKCSF